MTTHFLAYELLYLAKCVFVQIGLISVSLSAVL